MVEIRGLAAHAAGAQLLPYKYLVEEPGPQEVEVTITHCGVCHSDLHLIDNEWSVSKYPFIPGHEIVGTVTAVGADVIGRKVGERVGIGWQAGSCGSCEWCRQGDEHLCAKSQPTCIGRHGGYADSIRVNARFAIPVPEELESEHVAPLLCGGITVYNPLRNLMARPASRVGVVGIDGLGHLGLQFARAFGCEVTAFSNAPEKQQEAANLGAHHFVNTRDNGGLKKAAGSMDLILLTVPMDQDFQSFIAALRPKGTMVILESAASPLQIAGSSLVMGQKAIVGSPSGSPRDLQEMLDVAARHNVRAITERFAMRDANKAVDCVKRNQVHYSAVLVN